MLTISDTIKEDAKSAISRLKALLLHTVMLTGDSQASAEAVAEHYADVYDYEDYTRCAYYYRGTVQRTESSIRLFMENTVNPLDRCILAYPTPLAQRTFYTGMMTSVSISQYPPFSIKILLSHQEQKDEQWLKEQLVLNKDELKRIRKKNVFYVIQPEMEDRKI